MSNLRCYLFQPQDTLFFRDGRPYEQADDGLASAASLFPPHPPTVIGALRAALALGRGWDGVSPWADDLCAVLGDGPDLAGARAAFTAPQLVRQVADGWEPLFPAPNHLLVDYSKQPLVFDSLRPSTTSMDTDLGALYPLMPRGVEPSKNVKSAQDFWLTAKGMKRLLSGKPLDGDFVVHCLPSAALWEKELRVGLGLSELTRTAIPGQLYTPTHVRLKPDMGLSITVSGLPEDWPDPVTPIPLGGEHRFAHVSRLNGVPEPAAFSTFNRDKEGRGLILLTLLSPAHPSDEWLRPGPVLGGKIEILAACLGDPIPIGGWDSRRGPRRGPQPLRSFLPGGSCWFLRLSPSASLSPAEFVSDANDAALGFGRFTLGTYSFHGE